MELKNNTVLITGGGSGIGFALAKRFTKAGNQVIICGRRKEQLEIAKIKLPNLICYQVDVSQEKERLDFVARVTLEHPALNVLINNAGVQNRPAPLVEPQDWSKHRLEISTNLEAPIHLSLLFIPHLQKQTHPVIINVSSGLAFTPLSFMSTYCLTKAALHSFTMSLRHQLKATPIQVVELIPPAVNTDLGGTGLHTAGVNLDEFADHCMSKLEQGDLEFGFGTSEERRHFSREQLDQYFLTMNK